MPERRCGGGKDGTLSVDGAVRSPVGRPLVRDILLRFSPPFLPTELKCPNGRPRPNEGKRRDRPSVTTELLRTEDLLVARSPSPSPYHRFIGAASLTSHDVFAPRSQLRPHLKRSAVFRRNDPTDWAWMGMGLGCDLHATRSVQTDIHPWATSTLVVS